MDDSSSYEIKDLDAESVALAIEGCLPYLTDDELQIIADCFQYTPGDIKPQFLVANSEIKYLKDVTMLFNGKQTVLHSFYSSSNKVAIVRNFRELKEIIEKIKSFINTWDEILEEKPEEIEVVTTIQEPANEIVEKENTKISVEDIVAILPDGSTVNIPKGEYEILDTKELDNEKYAQIIIDGQEYWVKYEDDSIVPYTETEVVNEEANVETISDGVIKGSSIGTLLGAIASTFNILGFFEELGRRCAVILANGKYYQVDVNENGKIDDDTKPELIKETYSVVDDEITINVDGTDIVIKKGRYKILAIREVNGKKQGLILINGQYCWVDLDDNNKIVSNAKVEIQENTTIIVTDPVSVVDSTTNEEVIIKPGSYEVIDVEETTTPNQVIIEPTEDDYYVVDIDENNEIIPDSEATPLEPVEVEVENTIEIIANNNTEVEVTPGNYTVLAIKEVNGTKYGLVFINGEYYWVPLDENNKIIPSGETIPVNSLNYNLTDELTFVINGETVTLVPGEYQIIQVVPQASGGHAECVLINGKYVWIYFDHNGNFTSAFIELETDGVYTITGQLAIIDNTGGSVGLTNQYNYRIYAIRYDQFGNIIAIKISPPGYPEQWVVVRNNGVENGSYTKLDNSQSNPNNTVSYSYFDNHKILLGCLLGLATVLGGAIIYKKKKGSKEKLESYTVDDGEYPVFEEDMDENGNINSVRISNNQDDDDYWMEVG